MNFSHGVKRRISLSGVQENSLHISWVCTFVFATKDVGLEFEIHVNC